ncbi:helix-turn-helix domain-containing protein [Peribacillus simplex]|nr:helix-turn-helix domain-containing protein [Peribacillus simplex]MCM3677185.1 helix-turn-helix domain-containing protein [Peribacillus simplex]
MFVNKAYKFRIYPTKEQLVFINKTIGCSRFVYNFLFRRSRTANYPLMNGKVLF